MTEVTKQLLSWLAGISIHCQDQCCPDFSCCQPELLAPFEEREAFAVAYLQDDTEQYERMLMMFLGRGLKVLTKKNIYIAGSVK